MQKDKPGCTGYFSTSPKGLPEYNTAEERRNDIFERDFKRLITLLTIYDKSEKDNITEKEIIVLLEKNGII